MTVASCDRYGGLPTTTSTRPANADQSWPQRVAALDVPVRTDRGACRGDRRGIDVAADQHGLAAELADPAPRGDEEAPVAARRIDDDDVGPARVADRGGDHASTSQCGVG